MTQLTETIADLRGLMEKATKGDWHHCLPFQSVPAARTIHGPVPAQRVDYVSTWPGKGTPPGHRVVIPLEGRERAVSSDDMALIAAMKTALPALLRAAEQADALAKALEPFAEEEATWAMSVADNYMPGIVEPNQRTAHARAKFSIGDLRTARAALTAWKGQTND